MCRISVGGVKSRRAPASGERGFTLIEVMAGIVLLLFGLLAMSGVFPQGLALGLYGKDQTKATILAQQKVEYFRQVGIGGVGDYNSTYATECFTVDGSSISCGLAQAYFSRDVQEQFWVWNPGGGNFVIAGSPYGSLPTVPFIYRVSVAVHWLVRGQTVFQGVGATRGCVTGGTSGPTGMGCVQVSAFFTP